MRLSHACFWFGRQLMMGTTGWKDLSCTINPPKEDFESIQSSVAFFEMSVSDFLYIASLERKKETLR